MSNLTRKIGLGTVQFGTSYGISNRSGQTPVGEVSGILKIAGKNNIQVIDTAPAYGNAEKVLGRHDLSSFKVVSKFMPPRIHLSIPGQLQTSLDDLSIPALYGYLAHRPEQLSLSQWKELMCLKENGSIKKIGFSLNRPQELEKLLDRNVIPDLIQVPFNYFDRRFRNLMILLHKNGCEIHARSVFLQGLFFIDAGELNSYFEEVKTVIRNMREQVRNLPGALLHFVLNQPFIDSVIIGVENREQFMQNIEAAAVAEELPELKQEFSESILVPSNWPKKT